MRVAVKNEIIRLKLNINDIEIDRAHRSGPIFTDKNGKKQQTVLCKFYSWKARNTMFKARKNSNFYIKADLTKRRHQLFIYATNQMLDDQCIAGKLLNNIFVHSNCNIMAITSTGRHAKFNNKDEYHLMLSNLDYISSDGNSIFSTIAKDWASMHPEE